MAALFSSCHFDFMVHNESDAMKKEKREFVRAPLNIDARVKPIEKDEADRKRHYKSALSVLSAPKASSADSERGEAQDATLSYLIEFMFQINEKLDRVIELLGGGDSDQDHIQVVETVNISGSGVSFIVTRSVPVGSMLDISLFIPDFSLGMFNAQGEVIRVKPGKGDKAGCFEIGIKFLNLSEEEREQLIAFTFRQQRRTIRDTKDYN